MRCSLTEGSITVDTTTIVSDEDRRDNRMRSEGLQTDPFPTATFTITEPVDVPAAAADGEAVELTLVGDLELHGVTRSVSIPATAQLIDGQIQVAGTITFAAGRLRHHGAQRGRLHHQHRRRGRPGVPGGPGQGLIGPQRRAGAGSRR